MPAPLGNTPTKKMPKIEVAGTDDSRTTRAAVRFFRERRVVVSMRNLSVRPIEATELRQLLEQLGSGGLLESPAAEGPVDRGALLSQIRANPSLLRLPLVRHGTEVTAGLDETTWKLWLARRTRPAR
jgi:arsenate reductase (glutaredoxin)